MRNRHIDDSLRVVSTIALEVCGEARTVHLRKPMTITEIWHFFSTKFRRPDIITMSGGIGRVTYHERRIVEREKTSSPN